MRTLPSDLAAEISKESWFLAHLVEITLDSYTYRYCDIDMDIWHEGNQYLARGIEFDAANLSLLPKVDSITFEIDNVALEISSMVMNNEVRGKRCVIYRAAVDRQSLQPIGTATLFVGFLDEVEIDHQRGRFTVFNQFIKWKTPTPRRIHSATCPWTFKGAECGYSGSETWCDHSWDRCSTLGNTPSFGGFRWLPALQDKEISWGKKIA